MEFTQEEGRIVLYRQNEPIAYVTFPCNDDGVAIIDHTYVSDELRGQGVAGQLLQAAVAVIRDRGWKARPVCSYAVKWFEKHPENSDLLK